MATTMEDGIQAGKVDFGEIYDSPDPRSYYSTLGRLDYQIPGHGAEVFGRLVQHRANGSEGETTVLDLCCSYGPVPALMNHDLTLDELYDHYRQGAESDLTRDEQLEADRQLFAEHQHAAPATVVGVDVAANAVDYAVEAGLLDRGHAVDLEADDPPPSLAADLAEVDLITITGGVGYVGAESFDRLLAGADPDQPPWIGAMCLRWIDFTPVADTFERYGLVTEQVVEPSFRQRRFAAGEQDVALDHLADLGIDPAGKEAEGWHYADLYLARRAEEADAVPAGAVLGLDADAEVVRLG